MARLKAELWNMDEPKVWVPKSYGWGWGLNLAAIPQKLRRRQPGA